MDTSRTALWTAWRVDRDDEAFARLVRPEFAALYDAARRSGLGAQDAEDVVQESLSELASERSARPAKVGVGAWLMRSVRLKAHGVRRGDRRRRRREQHVAAMPRDANHTEGAELREQVEAALERLDDDDRQVLLFRFLYDLDYREIAYVLGISENACRIRVHRASKRLRDATGERGLTAIALIPLAKPPPVGAATAAAIAGAGAGTTAIGGALLGGLLMSAGTKVALGAAALVVIAAGAFFATRDDTPPPTEPPTVADVPSSPDPLLQGAAPEHRTASATAATPATDTPAAAPETPAPKGTIQAWLFVHVTDPRGAPLMGAQIEVLDSGMQSITRASTLHEGKTWFTQPEIAHVVVWKRGVYAPVMRAVKHTKGDDPQHVRVQLDAGHALAGRVEAHDGRALEKVSVSAVPVDPPAWLPNPRRLYRGRTDAHGRFEVLGLLPGMYELRGRTSTKRHPDAGIMPKPAPRFASGEREALLRLWPSGAFHIVALDAKTRGVVTSPRDLYRVGDDGDLWMQSVSGGGVKRVGSPGTVETLRLHAEGYAPSEPLVLDYNEPRVIEVLLEPQPETLGTIVFELVDDRGGAVRSFGCTRWHVRDVGGDQPVSYGVGYHHKDARGEHRLRLPAGHHRLGFDPRDHEDKPLYRLAPRDVEVTVTAGEEKHVRVAFVRTGSIRIPLPARWARTGLVLWKSDKEHVRRFELEYIDTGGRIFHRIVPGTYELELQLGQGKSLRREVTVKAGTTVEVDFEKPVEEAKDER